MGYSIYQDMEKVNSGEGWNNHGVNILRDSCKHKDGVEEKDWCDKCDIHEDSGIPIMNYLYPLELKDFDEDKMLKVVKETEGEEVEKDDEKKEKTKMPDLQIDLLDLKIGTVIYKDYSKGTPPKERVFNVNIDERYENITDPQSFVRLIILKALKNTTIASLTNFDLGKLQEGISGTVKKTAEMAQEAKGRAIEAGKDAGEKVKETVEETVDKAAEAGKEAGEKVKETAKETIEKAADTIKKILPFGK